MRDEFVATVKEALAKRVGFRCSNPSCRQLTTGPALDTAGVINVGVAAHITAAADGGPRYDKALSAEARKSADNGIWLCQKCAKLVDSDPVRYPPQILQMWRQLAEQVALAEVESRPGAAAASIDSRFLKAEALMSQLLREMRQDLANRPLSREFVILKRGWVYGAKGNELVYYYDDHPELANQLRVLRNLELIEEITYNKTDRFIITEELADYLTMTPTHLEPQSEAESAD